MENEYKEESNEQTKPMSKDIATTDINNAQENADIYQIQNFDLINLAYREGNIESMRYFIANATDNNYRLQIPDISPFFKHEIPHIVHDMLENAETIDEYDPNGLKYMILRYILSFNEQKERAMIESFFDQDFFNLFLSIFYTNDTFLTTSVSALIFLAIVSNKQFYDQFIESKPLQAVTCLVGCEQIPIAQLQPLIQLFQYILIKSIERFETESVITFIENIISIDSIQEATKTEFLEIISAHDDFLPFIGQNEMILSIIIEMLNNPNENIARTSLIILSKLYSHEDCDLSFDLDQIVQLIDTGRSELSQGAMELIQIMCANKHCIPGLLENNIIAMLTEYSNKSYIHKRMAAISISNLILSSDSSIYESLIDNGGMQLIVSSLDVDDDEVLASVLKALLFFVAVKDQPEVFQKAVDAFSQAGGYDAVDEIDSDDDEICRIIDKLHEIIPGGEES